MKSNRRSVLRNLGMGTLLMGGTGIASGKREENKIDNRSNEEIRKELVRKGWIQKNKNTLYKNINNKDLGDDLHDYPTVPGVTLKSNSGKETFRLKFSLNKLPNLSKEDEKMIEEYNNYAIK